MTKKEKDVVVGSLNPSGFEGEYKKKCFMCGETIHILNCWKGYNVDFSCMECMMKKHPKDFKFKISDETAKYFGMSKKFLKELGELRIEETKERKRFERIAG